ncbi:MAG TPA: site-specific integrase [Rubricoccaceae bacterium]
MASLIKVNTKYYLDFSDTARRPRRKRVALRVSSKRDAERLKARLEYEYSAGSFDPWASLPVQETAPTPPQAAPASTVRVAADAFYESRSHRTASTQRTYRDIVGRFAASLPREHAVAAVTAADIERWLDSLPAGDVTRRTYTKHLSTYFRFCVEAGSAPADVTAAVKLRRVPRTFPKALSTDEVAHLVEVIEGGPPAVHWLRDVVVFTDNTGLRRGEVVSLRWRSVDLTGAFVTVACDSGFQTKSGAERRVPLSQPALGVLSRLHDDHRARGGVGDDHVFRHARGPLGPDYLSQRFATWARAAGLEGTGFHGLRHTAISWLAERGVPLPVVQRFAGHADIAVTMRYVHVAPDVYADQIRSALE